MRRIFAAFAFLGLAAGSAGAQVMGLAAGAPGGTYIEIARDIAGRAATAGLTVTPRESRGSVENLLALHFTPGVQLALVQSDSLTHLGHLANMEGAEREGMLRMIDRTRLVMPLYTEEVHVLARPGITTLDDLNGRTVSIGPLDSGTFMTAWTLLRTAGIKPAKVETFTAEQSLDYLKRGLIDAMIYVAGQPVRLFAETLRGADGLGFVEISDSRLAAAGYAPVTIRAGSYAWMGQDIDTVGVTAALVTWDYRGETCGRIEALTGSILAGLEDLKSAGHRKWLEVDPARNLTGWTRSDCAAAALAAPPPAAAATGEPAGPAEAAGAGLSDILEGLQ